MIPKSERFDMRKRFLTFKIKAHKDTTPHLVIYQAAAPTRKLAVVVPKKSNKKATVRNELRRALKQQLTSQVKMHEVVVVTKPKAVRKEDIQALADELAGWLKQHV